MADWLTQGIRWRSVSFSLIRLQEVSRTATALKVMDLAAPVWRADFEAVPMYRDEAEAVHARFEALGGAATTFLAHTAQRRRPAAIPTGGLSTVKVGSINGDNDFIGLTGMPAGSRISTGDFLAILTQSGHRELVKAVGSVAANANTDTPLFQITPHVRPSVAVGDAVQLVDPRIEMRLEPGSLDLSHNDTLVSTVSFSALQVIR